MAAAGSCWPRVDETAQRDCCSTVHGERGHPACFNEFFSFEVCCLGKAAPFASWPVDIVILGFPSSGTTSMTRTLASHRNVTLFSRDALGRRWNKTEMQALNFLIAKRSRFAFIKLGWEMAREKRTKALDRFTESSSKLLMSDPTLMLSPDTIWAMLQLRMAKFLVMVRDPVSWFAASICRAGCTLQHQRAALCHRLPSWAKRFGSTWRAPLGNWLRFCEAHENWFPCANYSLATPYVSHRLQGLIEMLPGRSRLAVVSLESLKAEPRRMMTAIYSFLGLRPAQRNFLSLNAHEASHPCQRLMQNDARLTHHFQSERAKLAAILKAFSPDKRLRQNFTL
ncbi:unnamed protein product [Effrenium voratum]|uniref:Sulfotransferase domain-containing protein n=1 Tax=Effrenium voratum TaxID=2562239 RepID=A0AA36HKW7_9DINO|nr:unnamed protein product [Effrenium voratum]